MSGLSKTLQLSSEIDVSEYSSQHVYETWSSIERLSVTVADLIGQSGQHFDYAIIIGRGGFGPGNIIVRRLGFVGSEVLHIGMNSYGSEETPDKTSRGVMHQGKLHVGQVPHRSQLFSAKTGLVIDEVSDTGGSLEAARLLLKKAGFGEIRTAVLHWKDTKSSQPDYFAKVVNGWVHYPWEEHDELGQSIRKKRILDYSLVASQPVA